MLSKIEDYIRDKGLFEKTDKLLIGVSGGRDSVVLLHVLLELGYEVCVAHCNFNLRGEESNNEMLFVRSLCENYKIQHYEKEFRLDELKDHVGINIQLKARELRYLWFSDLLAEQGLSKVVTAHHLDDQIETFFINLSRGTGLKGLLGIPSKREEVVRPMLSISRDEITSYVFDNELEFKDDSSNKKEEYLRNKIRHRVVPEFKSVNPSFTKTFYQTINHLKNVQKYWKKSYNEWLSNILTDEPMRFEIDLIFERGEESFLTQLLNDTGFSRGQIEKLLSGEAHLTGIKLFSKTHRLIYNRGEWLLTEVSLAEEDKQFVLGSSNLPIDIAAVEMRYDESMELPTSKMVAWVDKSKIKGVLIIRRWKEGDYFYPLGMSGKKKLSDYFVDQKFSMIDKEEIWLLCDEKSIIWIVGSRLDNRFKITKKTSELIEFRVQW